MNIVNVISNKNVPKWGNAKQYIAVHYLGVVGQNNKVESGGYGAHYYIYWDGTIYQAASHDAILWQVGTGGYYTQKHPSARNSNTIGIEMCPKCAGNSSRADDPKWYFTTETQEACVWLVQKLMKDLGLPASHVLRHYDIVNKWCPAPYCNNNHYKTSWTWDEFKARISGSSSGGSSGGGSSSSTDKVYRIRKSWGDAASQIGAYSNLDNAKAACESGYTVYDWNGKAIYTKSGSSTAHVYRVRKSWADAKSQIGAYEDLTNAKNACKTGYTVYDENGKAVYSKSSSSSSNSGASSGNSSKELIKAGQIHANNFCGVGLNPDGVRGSATKKAGIKVLQSAMNLDYKAGLSVDGVIGSKTKAALKGHTVRHGESQYMVTALQILLMLRGYSPNGVESPGSFGDGCLAAVKAYQKAAGLSVDGIAGYDTFMSLIS